MKDDKRRRSRILGDISEGVVAISQSPQKYKTATKYFGQVKKSKIIEPRSASQAKLATSLDFSKFLVVPSRGAVSHMSKEKEE